MLTLLRTEEFALRFKRGATPLVFFHPCGTYGAGATFPPMNRWAIFRRPRGT